MPLRDTNPVGRRRRRFVLGLTAVGLAPLLAALSIVLLLGAWSLVWPLLAASLAGLGLGVALAAPRWRLRTAGLALVAVGAGSGWLAVRPAVHPANGARPIVTRCVGGAAATPWFGGIAEQDLVAVGAWLGLTRTEFQEVDGLRAELAALAGDAERFDRPASWVLDGWCADRGHYWLAAPRGAGPFPLLVFVHGSGGNFRCYPRTLGLAAAQHGVLAAFPTLGFGHRPPESVAERVEAVVADVQRDFSVDPARIVVVGLSAGAPGALAAVERLGALHPALVGISGAWPSRAAFAAGQRIRILHGDADERVPVAEARRIAAAAAAAGADARLDVVAGAGHLLLLRQPERALAAVIDALQR